MAGPFIPIRERCRAINNHFNQSWPEPAGPGCISGEGIFALIKEITPCIQMRGGSRAHFSYLIFIIAPPASKQEHLFG